MAFDRPLEADSVDDLGLFSSFLRAPVIGTICWLLGGEDAKKQADTPYLIWSYETHYANVLERFPDMRERIPQGGWATTGPNDPYEQYGRLNTQYRGEFPLENVTVKNSREA